jgi:hypothetical protein
MQKNSTIISFDIRNNDKLTRSTQTRNNILILVRNGRRNPSNRDIKFPEAKQHSIH